MICLKPLLPGTRDAQTAEALNRRAFPENEYVPMDCMLAESLEGATDVLGVYEEARFSGFLVMRRWKHIAYVSFFAIVEEARCRGVGGEALRLLRAYYPGRLIVVDFEAPDERADNHPQRLRRRAFYLRSGFLPTGWYAHYYGTEFEIVCSEEAFDLPGFAALFADLHARFPDFDPRLYRKDPS